MEVSFLFTKVRQSDSDYYKNLLRSINYIQGTIVLTLILTIDKSVNIKCYIDASFVVHKYMRSHTGGFMTIGTGGSYVQSRKQKLNTNSSTESNIFGADDVLIQVIWALYFLK